MTLRKAIAGLAQLTDLRISNNSITTLQPLVDNPEYGRGGELWIIQNPLPCSTQQPLLDELSARGLTVIGTCAE